MGERGGKREGAGRKKKDIKLGLDLQKNILDLTKHKAKLLAALHSEERINKFINVLDEMLNSDKETIRRDGAKMYYDIIIKTQTPEGVDPSSTGAAPEMTAEQLANIFRKELEEKEKASDGDPDMDSDGEDGFSPSEDP